MPDQEPVDTEAIAAAILTLRLNTAAGEWLSPEDEDLVRDMLAEVPLEDEELVLLSMMNLAWYSLTRLAEVGGLAVELARDSGALERMPELAGLPTTPQAWLQQLLLDLAEHGDDVD
jgi:hypothetical protein